MRLPHPVYVLQPSCAWVISQGIQSSICWAYYFESQAKIQATNDLVDAFPMCFLSREKKKQEVMTQGSQRQKQCALSPAILLASTDNRTGAGHWDTGLSDSPENRAILGNPVRAVEVPNAWAWSLDKKQGHEERLSVKLQNQLSNFDLEFLLSHKFYRTNFR